MSTRPAIALVVACLLASSCTVTGGDVDDGSTGGAAEGSGGGAPQSEGGANGGLEGVELSEPESPPLDLSFACPRLPDLAQTEVKVRPSSIGGFASAQYARSALAKGHWPDPTALRLEDFEAYYGDRLPITSSAQASIHLAPYELDGEQLGQLDVRLRLRPADAPSGIHLLVLADVSPSTDGTLAARESALDELASSIDADVSGTAKMSIITFGETPQVILDRVPSGSAVDAFTANKSQLAPRSGNDLRRALTGIDGLLDDVPTHVLLITDGGVKWDAKLEDTLSGYRDRGVSLSIAQIGQTGATVDFLNDELLEGFARAGGGTRLFLPGDDATSSEAQRIFRDRYQEVFSIAVRRARVSLILPPGIAAVPPVDGGGLATPAAVGFGRPFGASFAVTRACDGAFDSDAIIQVNVIDDRDGILYAATPTTANQATNDLIAPHAELSGALRLTVEALRKRQAQDLEAAITAVQKLATGPQLPCDAVAPDSCQAEDICCIRADLMELLGNTCPLLGESRPSACEQL